MMRIGYARVSTGDQHPESQVEALLAAGVERENIYTDHGASGRKAHRPQWDLALSHLRKGDQLVITRLDRAGRSALHLAQMVDGLHKRGVNLLVTEQAIDTSTAMGRCVFTIMSAIAEFEIELNHERTREGLEAARAKGNFGGGQPKLTAKEVEMAQKLHGTMSARDAAQLLGVSRATYYRAIRGSIVRVE